MRVSRPIDIPLAGFALCREEECLHRVYGAGDRVLRATSRDAVRWESERPFAVAEGVAPTWAEVAGGEMVLLADAGEGPGVRLCRQGTVRPVMQPDGRWYEKPDERGGCWGQASVLDLGGGKKRAFWSARSNRGQQPDKVGCVATGVSEDLVSWQVETPAYAPDLYAHMRWPQVSVDPSGTTLFFTTDSSEGPAEVRYARAPAAQGPYEKPERDLVCRDARVAVRVVEWNGRRLAFFLCRSEAGWHLAGPTELAPAPDGTPVFRFFDGLIGLRGEAIFETDAVLAEGEMLIRIFPRSGHDCLYEATVESFSGAAGLVLRASMTGRDNVIVWLDFRRDKVFAERGARGRGLASARAALRQRAETKVLLWAEGNLISVYVADKLVLVTSCAERLSGAFGVAAERGETRFRHLRAFPILKG